jgi:very-short-patch-repair endonuclease
MRKYGAKHCYWGKINPEKLTRARELRRNMTPGEKILWRFLRSNKFKDFHFRRQQVIDGYIAELGNQ